MYRGVCIALYVSGKGGVELLYSRDKRQNVRNTKQYYYLVYITLNSARPLNAEELITCRRAPTKFNVHYVNIYVIDELKRKIYT